METHLFAIRKGEVKMSNSKLPKGITLRKDGLYMGRFKYQNETYTIYGKNLKKLEKQLSELRYEVTHGLKGKGDNMALNAWFEIWLYDYKSKTIKDSTMIRYEDQYKQNIKKQLGQKKLSQIKPIMLQRLFNQMVNDGYSTKTIADTYNVLHSMFKMALQNNIIFRNPCDAVILPKTTEKERRVLTIEEQKDVLEHAKGRVCEQQIRVALGTGMRAGELQGLTWDDIDFDKREIRVNKTLVYIRDRASGKYYFKFQTPKTKSGTRTIPMQEDVYNALKRQKVQIKEMQMLASNWNQLPGFENLVFLNVTGRPRQGIDFRNDLLRIENAINKERKRVAEQEGTSYEPIAHIYPHCLRHSFATRCFEAGIDAKTVQNYLGHSSFAITMDLYTHVTEDKAHSEMQKLNQLYQMIG